MMKYYKIIYKKTGQTMCYASGTDYAVIKKDISSLLGDEYAAEEISKEEYEKETDDRKEEEEL